jgi:DNA-binding response OmpR family regulator
MILLEATKMAVKILIADDSEGITEILETYALREGYIPSVAHNGVDALALFMEQDYDLLLLDVMMPGKDGFALCREIRQSSNVPIIMITARGEDADRIMGLDIGADDYIVKPFSPGEVMARIRAILRRIEPQLTDNNDTLNFPALQINIADYQVQIDGQDVSLTKKEMEIFWLLAASPGKVFSRDNLLNSIWGYDYYGDSRTVDTHIKRLRAKIMLRDDLPWDIKTIWGVGYKFEANHV